MNCQNFEDFAGDRSLWRHVENAATKDATKGILAGLQAKYLCNKACPYGP